MTPTTITKKRPSSTEQLDRMVRMTTPAGWIALLSIWIIILTALVWGWFGSIPTKITGKGILLREGGVHDIIALGDGQVESVHIKEGDTVEKNQIIAYVDLRDLKAQRAATETELASLTQQYQHMQNVFTNDLKKQKATYKAQRFNLRAEINTIKQRQEFLKGRLGAQETLLKKGLVTEKDVFSTQENIQQSYEDQRKAQINLEKIDTDELQLETSRERDLFSQRLNILETQNKLDLIKEQISYKSVVRSVYAGRIIQVMVKEGLGVNTGGTIANLEKHLHPLQAVVYVPPGKGANLIKTGMTVQIVPTTVKRDEYGFMVGKVSFISSYNASTAQMKTVLGNEDMAKLFNQAGPPVQIIADLEEDPATFTKFKWSSGKGPPYAIVGNTTLDGEIVVLEQPPITLLIPLLKKWFGLAG